MGKRRERHQNPQPFLPVDDVDDVSSVPSTNKRSKAPCHQQKQEKFISSGMSSKILKEALIQQREIEEESELSKSNDQYNAFSTFQSEEVAEEENIDDFRGFSDVQSFDDGGYEEVINEEDEKILEAFFSKDARPLRTLTDIIIEKIKYQDANVSSDSRPLPKLDQSIIDVYKGVGKFLSNYTAGKMPKAFKHIPSMQLWEDVLYLTEPENWSPNALYQATRIFASNFGGKKAERFYRLVLLPRIRDDIKKNKRLHFALYQAVKKSLYKPAAFNKGILFPLCKSGTCSLKEAFILGSIMRKVSIPMLHSSVALLKLAEMEYRGTTSFFIELLLEKKYALPYRVVDALVAHFMKFIGETRSMPVIWHLSLLVFVQRYKNELRKEDKNNLRILLSKMEHKKVTPEIIRELDNSQNRGEKSDSTLITSPISVINKTIEEDRFDIPDVPMEED
ncbi:hypothetical protein K2173_025489 [Erythroxylum novogranatense]|uniref:Bystin n=1 Tax=Erythroxylum novogranatense TaxID=1862640 RepID=A0AAV8UDW1_9ROSI|nr:hypothetical protein K2173_025489 [Erythroxylum novogranatense]